MTQRLGTVYFILALFLSVPVGRMRDLAGTGVLLAAYAVFVALTAAVIWKLGAAKTGPGRAREHPAFLPGVLLVAGPLVLLLGASVTGAPTATRPGDYLLNTTSLLSGSVIMVVGFVALFARLWQAGERLLPILGLSSLLVGSAVWLANLVFRYAVVASGAAGLQARVEARAWFADVYLRGFEGEPSWMAFLLVWTDMLQLAFVVLAYLAAAAFGGASTRAGWFGRSGGRIFVALNLALPTAVTAAVALAGYGSTLAALTALVLTIPFMVFILPYFAGTALILRGGRTRPAMFENAGAAEELPW